ncbi:MAG: hypothetical protein Tsb005_18950 [Gammaproteobacteria bacterium]
MDPLRHSLYASHSEYTKFKQDFKKSIKVLEKKIEQLKTNTQSIWKLNTSAAHTRSISSITNSSSRFQTVYTPPPIHNTMYNHQDIKRLEAEKAILQKALDTSTPRNFEEKRADALKEIERLDNPTSAVALGAKRY